MARDARQDGRFVFAVRTTGSLLPAFLPQPPAAARLGGVLYQSERSRTCGLPRLPALQADGDLRAGAIRHPRAQHCSTTLKAPVTLAELSKRIGLSPFHLQRLFKRATGLSPREYQAARRMQHVKSDLRKGDDVTTALYDAGFGSPSRLYEKAPQQLGMTPGEYRRGGAGASIRLRIAAHTAGPACWWRQPSAVCARFALAKTLPSWSAICATSSTPLRCIATMQPCGNTSSRCWLPFAARKRTVDLAARRPRYCFSDEGLGEAASRFRVARRAATATSPAKLARLPRFAPWPAPAPRIPWPWPYRATVSSAATEIWPDTAGASRERRSCWSGSGLTHGVNSNPGSGCNSVV